MPGESAIIEYPWNTQGRPGVFQKYATVITSKGNKAICIKGNIENSKLDFNKVATPPLPLPLPPEKLNNLDDYVQFDSSTKYAYNLKQDGQGKTFCFFMKNISNVDIIIENVQSGCGCIVPNWSREPIQPSKIGWVEGTFNTMGRPGVFSKIMTVHTNRGKKQVYISGNVLALEPVNEKKYKEDNRK